VRRAAALAAGVSLLCVGALAATRPWEAREGEAPASPAPPAQPAPPGQPVARQAAPRPRHKGWREYRAQGVCAVVLPGEPKVTSGKTEVKGHPTRQALAIDMRTGTGFLLTTSPHRDPAATPQEALRARRDEVLSPLKAAITSEREVAHDRYPGVECTALVHAGHFKGHWVRMRVFLVREHHFLVLAMGREAFLRPDDTEVTWFFDSFRVLTPDAAGKLP
jgi:hypothetical protein